MGLGGGITIQYLLSPDHVRITIFYFSCNVLQPSARIATILEKLTVAHMERKYNKIYEAQRLLPGNPSGNHKDYSILGCDAI